MASNASANGWLAASEGLGGLMAMLSGEKRRKDALARQDAETQQEQQKWQTQVGWRNEDATRADTYRQQDLAREETRLAAEQARRDTEYLRQRTDAAADDTRDYNQQLGLVREQARLRPAPQTPRPEPVRYQYTTDGKIFNPATGEFRPASGGGEPGGNNTGGATPQALSALDRYESLAGQYMKLSPMQRAVGQFSGNGLAAQLEAARNALMFEVKNAAKLGQLSGGDLDMMNQLVGDPTSLGAMGKKPEDVLSRIPEVRGYLTGGASRTAPQGGPTRAAAATLPGAGAYRPTNPYAR